MSEPRAISVIASDIRRIWQKPNFAAKPYIDAMMSLNVRGDQYGVDSSDDILIRFFSNASTFRGDKAKALKYELAHHLSPSYQKDFLKKFKPAPLKSTR